MAGLDVHTDALDSLCLVLNDLQLRHNRSSFQIDTLVICPDRLLLYEAKNYKGVHTWGPLTFLKTSGVTLENPSIQLQRTQVRLEVLLTALKIQMPIEAYVVNINPEFTLMEAQQNADYLLPSQLPHYFQNLQVSGKTGPEQQRLADTLIRLPKPHRFVDEMPTIDYGQLRKDLYCLACWSAVRFDGIKSVYCPVCKKRERTINTIAYNIEEFPLLFPDEKVTTPRMAEWCGMENKDHIYRVLSNSYQAVGKRHGAITCERLNIVKGKNSDEATIRRSSCLFVISNLD